MTSIRMASFLGALATLVIAACTDTYCQSGAKYGTQCMSLTDARNPPGQRPPLSNEPPAWYTSPPPPRQFGAPKSAYPPPPYPTISPAPAAVPSADAGAR